MAMITYPVEMECTLHPQIPLKIDWWTNNRCQQLFICLYDWQNLEPSLGLLTPVHSTCNIQILAFQQEFQKTFQFEHHSRSLTCVSINPNQKKITIKRKKKKKFFRQTKLLSNILKLGHWLIGFTQKVSHNSSMEAELWALRMSTALQYSWS